jgi:hypothetical protein
MIRPNMIDNLTRLIAPITLALFVLTGSAAFASAISGSVSSTAGQPLGGMTVQAYSVSGGLIASTSSDDQGQFRLELAPGIYRLLAFDPAGNYATNFYENASSFETSSGVVVGTSDLTGIAFVLQPAARIAGSVKSSSGALSGNIIVEAYNLDGSRRASTRAAANGSYQLTLPPGTYKLIAFDEAGKYVAQFYAQQPTFAQATTVAAVAGQTTGGIDITLQPGVKVSGVVLDRNGGAPLAGKRVELYSATTGQLIASTSTGFGGEFAVTVAPGRYKLVAYDPAGFYTSSFYNDAVSYESASTIDLSSDLANVTMRLELRNIAQPTTSFVPTAANTPGANGTYFLTDVWIHNSATAFPLIVKVAFLPSGHDNSSATFLELVVQPGQQLYVSNILERFGATGAGALRFDGDRPFEVMTRTFNRPSNAAQVGTFGLAVAGADVSHSISRGIVNGLANNISSRSNVGMLNPHAYPLHLLIRLFDRDGSLLGETTRDLAPFDHTQLNTIFAAVGSQRTTDSAYCTIDSADGSFFAYGSVVDNISGDGSYVEAKAH